MLRRTAILIGLSALVLSGCSKAPERGSASALAPTAPTAVSNAQATDGIVISPGLSGPMDVLFPARNETLDFRRQLETRYQTTLQRTAAPTTVDLEGDAVWTQEYIRYRVNGCDHATSVARTLAQVTGGAAAAVCANVPEGGVVTFPPRSETVDFRRQLETVYQVAGRSSSSAVDPDGSAIWIQEYLRYRTNACSQAVAVQSVFTQLDGNPAPATCYAPPACVYAIAPSGTQTLASTTTSSSVELQLKSGSCTWTASSDSSWLTLGTTSGGDRTLIPFTMSVNRGGERYGKINVSWTGGSAVVNVTQQGPTYNTTIEMLDPNRSGNPGTECQIRSLTGTQTTCTMRATTNLPGAIVSWDWQVAYTYSVAVTRRQNSTSNTFAISETCGQTGSSSGGSDGGLTVTLTVTDDRGNTSTVVAGQGFQSAMALKFYTCGV